MNLININPPAKLAEFEAGGETRDQMVHVNDTTNAQWLGVQQAAYNTKHQIVRLCVNVHIVATAVIYKAAAQAMIAEQSI